MEQDTQLVLQSVDAVKRAGDLDTALLALVTVLRPRFQLFHASIATHPEGAPHFRVLAAWSLADSLFDKGAEISATISEKVEFALETLRKGRPLAVNISGQNPSLVDHLLREQGVASILVFPVQYDDQALMIVALGSSTTDAFLDAERGFFTALSMGIRDTLTRLSTATNT
jgi:GAF domain-containing protein